MGYLHTLLYVPFSYDLVIHLTKTTTLLEGERYASISWISCCNGPMAANQ